MDMVIALLPALFFGATGIITTLLGGKAVQGTLGMTYGAVIFGLGLMLIYVVPNAGWDYVLNPRIWVVGLFSGLFWAVGSAGQFTAMKQIGVTLAIPLSTAGQIVTNALMAALVLGEWNTGRMWLFGLISVALVCVGALCTSVQDKSEEQGVQQVPKSQFTAGLISVAISTLGFMLYFVFPNLLSKIGYISDDVHDAPNGTGVHYMTAVIAPQSIGMLAGALLIVLFVAKEPSLIVEKHTFLNMITGVVWAIGNVLIFISCANPNIGQAVATTFSQLNVIVAVLGGILILHEKRTRRQLWFIALGTLLIAAGAVLMVNRGVL